MYGIFKGKKSKITTQNKLYCYIIRKHARTNSKYRKLY